MEDLFKDHTFGQLALQKMGQVPEDFILYSAGWLGNGNERKVMSVTGAQFRRAKSGPRKGQLVVRVPGTVRTEYVTAAEIAAAEAA